MSFLSLEIDYIHVNGTCQEVVARVFHQIRGNYQMSSNIPPVFMIIINYKLDLKLFQICLAHHNIPNT